MKNVTVTMEDEVARWVRIEAAKRETSVSRLVGELVRERMIRERGYQEARDAFFAVEPQSLRDAGSRLPAREDLHDRDRLR